MSADASGAPRLIRAIAPRPGGAGMTASAAAQDHVAALSQLYVQQAPAMQLVENSTQQLRNGATLVKLDQMVDGVIVNQGELRVLMHTDGALAAVSGTLLAATVKPSFVSTPSQALDRALDKQFGATRPQLAITEAGTSGSWQKLDVAPTTDLVIENARARRELARIGDKLTEVWAVEVEGTAVADPAGDPDITAFSSHRYLVKDLGGAILRDDDLVQSDAFVYRVYADNTGIRRPFDGALASFAPHPTGIPDGSAPGVIPANLVVMEGFNGNLDPWLATNATTTLGNNAEAFADMDGTNNSSPSDVRPEVRAGRVLNYTYDHTLGPLANATQSKAAAVNAFYLVNWMHDWWYDSGFTEATANAQADNFGRGGVAGDPLLVLAQAGANIGNRNNANMATPADGARPRMRMYLWTAGTATSVTGPAGVLATTEPFAAGPRNFDLTGDLVAAVDPTAPTDDACQAPTNVAGKIALVTFSGACGSLATVNSVRAAGAVGIILEDPASDNPRAFAGSAAANIPGLAIGRTAGESLKAALGSGPVTVTLHSAVAGPERDGDLDNTVVAHEWGHYLHHRLTSCGGQQCGGMSEGWGDFNALMMMLREGENRDGVYAIGPYALADGVTADVPYFGIRRYPYSIDRTKNDLSFRHVSDGVALPTDVPGFPVGPNSEVHNAGEIWATMMWEVVNVLADEHGVAVARRRMSDYVVGGLLLAPPEATFTETRDAMLAAASALDTDDMILMAAAFAGRGMGSCAVSPPVDSPTNAGVVESGTLAAKLAMGGVSLTDDGISCDHDGYLDPGESGTLHVTLANNGILAADNVTLTATTSATGVRLGAPLKFSLVQPLSSSNLAIPVTVLQSAPRNALVTINLHVAGENTCDRNGVDIALTIRTGADDAPNTSATDNAETLITAWTAAGGGAADLWGKAREAGGNQSFFGKNAGFPSDTQFASPSLLVGAAPLVISFNHRYNLEGAPGAFFDGGVLEISQDGGATWSDVTTFGVNPGYTGALFVGSGNPIQGRNAYSGVSPGFPARQAVSLNFGTAFAGQSLQFRFRLGTDANTAFSGWDIDDVQVSGITNTPFPTVVSEPSTCTARKAPGENIGVLATLESPRVSLDGFDAAVCIKNDIE